MNPPEKEAASQSSEYRQFKRSQIAAKAVIGHMEGSERELCEKDFLTLGAKSANSGFEANQHIVFGNATSSMIEERERDDCADLFDPS